VRVVAVVGTATRSARRDVVDRVKSPAGVGIFGVQESRVGATEAFWARIERLVRPTDVREQDRNDWALQQWVLGKSRWFELKFAQPSESRVKNNKAGVPSYRNLSFMVGRLNSHTTLIICEWEFGIRSSLQWKLVQLVMPLLRTGTCMFDSS
jgi:hypothetical protein